MPLSGNTRPSYPDAARKRGREGVVVLRLLVGESGAVENVEVLAGEEPFVAAALAAVRTWRYQPTRLDDRPLAIHREIRLPFRRRDGA